MIQFIQHILPRIFHLGFTLHGTVLDRTQKILYGYLIFLLNCNDFFGVKYSIGYYKVLF